MMLMRLGIVARYHRCESTMAALRIADWARSRGGDVTLYARDPGSSTVSHWDKHVRGTSKMRFTDWSKHRDVILWTQTPPVEQIDWCKKHKIRTVILCLLHELKPEDRQAYMAADCVLAPTNETSKILKRHWGLQARLLPWDPGLPFTRKDPRVRLASQWVFLPLFDREPYKTEMTILVVMERMLARHPRIVLTVGYNSSTLETFARRQLDQLKDHYGDRVQLAKRVSVDHRALLFRDHDLTIWPTHYEDTGMIGLSSLQMGTPVISFQFPPLTEFLTRFNSIQVPCQLMQDGFGMTIAEPDYELFETRLNHAITDPNALFMIQQTVWKGMTARRQAFTETLSQVLA